MGNKIKSKNSKKKTSLKKADSLDVFNFENIIDKGKSNSKNNNSCILFLHGYTAKPSMFLQVVKNMRKNSFFNKYDFFIPAQPHSKILNKNLSKQTYKDWINFAENYYSDLEKKYKEVLIIAHSLGGNIAVNLAYKKNLKKIILISSPLKIDLKLLTSKHSKDKDVSFLTKFNVIRLIIKTNKLLPLLKAKILYFIGSEDEVVSLNTPRLISSKISSNNFLFFTIYNANHSKILLKNEFIKDLIDNIKLFLK